MPADGDVTPYSILGVAEDAPFEVIRAAHKALVFKHHPDRNPSDPHAGLLVSSFNRALEMLATPEERAKTDLAIWTVRMKKRVEEGARKEPPADRRSPTASPPPAAATAKTHASKKGSATGCLAWVFAVFVASGVRACVHEATRENQAQTPSVAPQVYAPAPPPSKPQIQASQIMFQAKIDPSACSKKYPLSVEVQNNSPYGIARLVICLHAFADGDTAEANDLAKTADGGLVELEMPTPIMPLESKSECWPLPDHVIGRKRSSIRFRASLVSSDAVGGFQ